MNASTKIITRAMNGNAEPVSLSVENFPHAGGFIASVLMRNGSVAHGWQGEGDTIGEALDVVAIKAANRAELRAIYVERIGYDPTLEINGSSTTDDGMRETLLDHLVECRFAEKPRRKTESDRIYACVVDAMQDAEEMHGPEPGDYLDLMERIAAEATQRAANLRASRAIEQRERADA